MSVTAHLDRSVAVIHHFDLRRLFTRVQFDFAFGRDDFAWRDGLRSRLLAGGNGVKHGH